MQQISIALADNGVIKTVIDDNINSAGEIYESTVVYELDNDNQNKIKFIYDICLDAGIDFGNSKSKKQIQIIEDWGEHYTPTKNEIEEKIKALSAKIKMLESALVKK